MHKGKVQWLIGHSFKVHRYHIIIIIIIIIMNQNFVEYLPKFIVYTTYTKHGF
jgi:hypothetical protein